MTEQSKPFRCLRCGSTEGYRSRPRNLFEKFCLPLVSMQTVRCGQCFRRTYRPRSVKVSNPAHDEKSAA
ncbi:MAG TPA: hypothetical protein VLV49_09045 [Terriglobales bacterium]|nr:hypothetical protein [Terriglobales bacterium]